MVVDANVVDRTWCQVEVGSDHIAGRSSLTFSLANRRTNLQIIGFGLLA